MMSDFIHKREREREREIERERESCLFSVGQAYAHVGTASCL